MRDTDLFQLALGLMSPWMVGCSQVRRRRQTPTISRSTSRAAAASPARPARRPTARPTTPSPRPGGISISSSTKPTCTRACPASPGPDCGVRQVEVPWARPGSGFTLLFEAFAMTLVTHMPVAAAARLL